MDSRDNENYGYQVDPEDDIEVPEDETAGEENEARKPEKKSRVPLYLLGGVVVASLAWVGYQGMNSTDESSATTPPTSTSTATAPPTIIGTPDPSTTDQPGEFKDGVYVDPNDPNNSEYVPNPVEDPEPTFTSIEEPPKSVEERAFPSQSARAIQAPETDPWQDTVTEFAKDWSNPSVGKDEWLKKLRPNVTDRAYDLLKYTDIRGLEKRTVSGVEEYNSDATGFAFKVNFSGNGVEPMYGSVIMDPDDDYKWKVDRISRDAPVVNQTDLG